MRPVRPPSPTRAAPSATSRSVLPQWRTGRSTPSSAASRPHRGGQLRAVVAELPHVAEDRDAATVPGEIGEQALEGGAHGLWVRVVGVVDQRWRRWRAHDLQHPSRRRDPRSSASPDASRSPAVRRRPVHAAEAARAFIHGGLARPAFDAQRNRPGGRDELELRPGARSYGVKRTSFSARTSASALERISEELGRGLGYGAACSGHAGARRSSATATGRRARQGGESGRPFRWAISSRLPRWLDVGRAHVGDHAHGGLGRSRPARAISPR